LFADKYAEKGKSQEVFSLIRVEKLIGIAIFLLKIVTVALIGIFFHDTSLPIHPTSVIHTSWKLKIIVNALYGTFLLWICPTVICLILVYVIFGLAIPLSMVRVNSELDTVN